MHETRRRKEHAIAGHGVVHAGTSECHGADARGQADDRDNAHDVAGARAEQLVSDNVEHAALHLGERSNGQYEEVQKV